MHYGIASEQVERGQYVTMDRDGKVSLLRRPTLWELVERERLIGIKNVAPNAWPSQIMRGSQPMEQLRFDPTVPQPFQSSPTCPFCGYVEANVARPFPMIEAHADNKAGLCKMRCTTCKGEWVSLPFALSEAAEPPEIPESVRKAFLDHYKGDRLIGAIGWFALGTSFGALITFAVSQLDRIG